MVTGVHSRPLGPRLAADGGFTLIELLVVVTVLGILLAIAVPSFTEMSANNRVRASAQEFHAALHRARSEALKRNRTVTIRRVGDAWTNGWQILDEVPDPDEVIQSGAPAAGVQLSEASSLTRIDYLRSGRLATGATVPFMRIADVGGRAEDRCVRVDLGGRPSIIAADHDAGDAC